MSDTNRERPADLGRPGGLGAESAARQDAWHRVQKRRKFQADVVAYVVINAFLVGVWALTGRGYFWPAWVMAAWGIALLLGAWDIYARRPVSEADIEAELRKSQR